MNCCVFSWRRSGLAWAALLLAGSPAWAQGVPNLGGPPLRYGFGILNPTFSSPFSPSLAPAPVGYGVLLPYAATGSALRPLAPSPSSRATFGPTQSPWLNWPADAKQPDSRARIRLHVPADAEVWFEGVKTRQTGAERYFFSPPLAPGATYAYEVEARWKQDGKTVERRRQIVVHAGDALRIDLAPPAAAKDKTTAR
jgi:uncharacterized protein (TIGR03000 family)